jgi:ABC-type transport system substrate-binding protein
MKKLRLTRSARSAVIALLLTLLVAAPAAAAQPTRTVIVAGPPTHYPAGEGCADFAVSVYRPLGGWTAITDFRDGRESLISHVIQRMITNDATGATFVETSIAHEVDRFENGQIVGMISGQFIWQFYPGDVGPDGAVLDHVLALYIQGSATYVVDGTTFATLEISIKGTITDICAALS